MFGFRSPKRKRRAQLGAPIIPINPSANYLRHRSAAARAIRERSRARRRLRFFLLSAGLLLYFAIGRDLLLLGRARASELPMNMRKEVHSVVQDLKRVIRSSQFTEDSQPISPVAFTSAAALVNAADPEGLDAMVSDEPLQISPPAP